ncbi:hypothetical protein [Sphingomonas humi]|uniref:Uncharacterized protein n=1 Tax=Sphingomonas humi TaxID=335630 RepID=A0ABP7RWK6_9SPHN
MSLFEMLFALSSVILGLALTNIAASLHRLALAARRVRWAPEPLLQALLITVITLQVWLDQWYLRHITELVYASASLTILRLMTLYFAAASCLPEGDLIGEGEVDLKTYYYDTRRLSYGAMIVGLWLFALNNLLAGGRDWMEYLQGVVIGPAIYGLLIWTRRRWVHIAALLFVLVVYGIPTMLLTIKA